VASVAAAAPDPSAIANEEAVARSEARARDVLDTWLLAQNAGDFPAYEKLYARQFMGIKRMGERLQHFDRAGWMKDRQSMFLRPFSVGVGDVRVSATARSAMVEFAQTWTSAAFRDEGTKQLMLVDEGGTLRISSEEMKESRTGAARPAFVVPTPREFAFVVEAPEPLLLLSSKVDPKWVSGPPRYVAEGIARRGVASERMPTELRELAGSKFTIYASTSVVCEATVTGFEALADVQLPFNWWEGRVVSQAERADDLWSFSEGGGRFLVALLETSKPCAGGRWARAATLPPAELWTSRPPTDQERLAQLRAVRSSPQHRDLQREFELAFGKAIPWDDSGEKPELAVFEGGGGQTFAALTLRSGLGRGCGGEFDVDVFFLLQKRGGTWAVVSAGPDGHVGSAWPRFLMPLRAELAFDLEADGRPEFIGWRDFIRESGGAYRSVLNRGPGYFACPC
jgi:hypothetical protein